MEWVKLHATPPYYLDGALLRAGEAAEVLFLRALAYSGNGDTRGLVDKTVLPLICPVRPQPRADALVREGLWLDEGLAYRVRSWDRIQDEHDAAADRRNRDKERKAKARKAQREADLSADSPGTSVGRPSDACGQGAESPPLEKEKEKDEEKTPPTGVVATGKPSTPKRATRVPDTFPADEDRDRLAQWAAEAAPAVSLVSETHNWQDWHRAKGDTAKDWNASWRTWMRRAQKDAEKRPGGQLALVRPANPRVAEQDATLRRWMTEATGGSA